MRYFLIPLSLVLLLSVSCAPKHYTATATVELLNQQELREFDTDDNSRIIVTADRIDVKISILKSAEILQHVAMELASSGQKEMLTAPYGKGLTSSSMESILSEHRSVEADQSNQMLHISYAHPDPEVAATVANLFAESFMTDYFALVREDEMKEIEDLRIRADQQKDRVEALELKLANERERKGIDGDIYKALLRELDVQHGFLKALVNQMSQIRGCGMGSQYARIIDRAVAPEK